MVKYELKFMFDFGSGVLYGAQMVRQTENTAARYLVKNCLLHRN